MRSRWPLPTQSAPRSWTGPTRGLDDRLVVDQEA